MIARPDISAWRPPVQGITEVFHARFTNHAYPMHTHDSWTLLIVDDGMVKYDLDRHEHGAMDKLVTLLPPHVPHNGMSVTPDGFRKRVLYLDSTLLSDDLIGLAVGSPVLDDQALRHHIHLLHTSLMLPGEELEAECRLAVVSERLQDHMHKQVHLNSPMHDPGIARRLRDLLDERYVDGITLQEASSVLHAHPAHLVRAFSAEFGMGPHKYLTGRRVDLARRLLLDGLPPRTVATAAGFFDQSHLTRHFKRILGTTPGHYARTGPAADPAEAGV
jgi:AraC-like DNA-binding protein